MRILFVFCLMFSFYAVLGQGAEVGKLKEQIRHAGETKDKADLLSRLAYHYTNIDVDTAIQLADEAIAISKKLHYTVGEASGLISLGRAYMHFGNNDVALDKLKDAAEKLEGLKEDSRLGLALVNISLLYAYLQSTEKSFDYAREALLLAEKANDPKLRIVSWLKLCDSYSGLRNDSMLILARLTEKECLALKDSVNLARSYSYLGAESEQQAADYRRASLVLDQATGNNRGIAQNYLFFSRYYENRNMDSALYYAEQGYAVAGRHKFAFIAKDVLQRLSKLYEVRNDPAKALYYHKLFIQAVSEFYSQEKTQGIRNLELKEQKKAEEEALARKAYRNRMLQFALGAGLLAFVIVAIILSRNNNQKQKANRKLASTLEHLRNTQAQLIQSEKMASLGQLTAGVAHEIQNPLNFVNNFSEVSRELLEEMNEQLAKGNMQEANQIGEDIKRNLDKILHHGKRADGIVKGMLQHSRSSSGLKELADINMLAEEYLRLAYHGWRAKDKAFSVELKTDFDRSLDKIAVVPQEIGRVLVNLLNNAFYAVNEKRKKAMNGYEPLVILSTRKKEKGIEIIVKDNGKGIPKEALNKIFQPFFTTKPTGQGTGLGLSLSYDIIKAHGGDLQVETSEEKGTAFIISLS